jgi:transposase
MARRTKRLWTDEEKRSICFQTTAPDISVAQVARRYAMNANLIFKWLRDSRFAPGPEVVAEGMDAPCFLPVEIVGQAHDEDAPLAGDADALSGMIEIDVAGGHRLRINGAYDPEALARLIRGFSA